jgi:hypothetical protein
VRRWGQEGVSLGLFGIAGECLDAREAADPLAQRYDQGQPEIRLARLNVDALPLPLAVGARPDELGRDLGLVRTDGEPDADFRERLSRSPLQGLSVTMRLRGTIYGA